MPIGFDVIEATQSMISNSRTFDTRMFTTPVGTGSEPPQSPPHPPPAAANNAGNKIAAAFANLRSKSAGREERPASPSKASSSSIPER